MLRPKTKYRAYSICPERKFDKDGNPCVFKRDVFESQTESEVVKHYEKLFEKYGTADMDEIQYDSAKL